MRTVAVLQARMTSIRLPGKVLMEVEGAPMLARQLARLAAAKLLDEVVVATTVNTADDRIVAVAEEAGVRCYRGAEQDVLARYVGAAREAAADVIVRTTADCPLIDPEVMDRVVAALDAEADYAANVLERTFPVGLDVEALFADVLFRLDRLARSPDAREHVTSFIRFERPDLFQCRSVIDDHDNSDLRWTVDTAEDLETVRRLYRDLGLAGRLLPYREVVEYARREGIGLAPRISSAG